MAKRCIGLDISSSSLRAVQVARQGEELHVERVFSKPMRRSTDSPVQMIQSLLAEHQFDKRAPAAVSMPHEQVFFTQLTTHLADIEQVRQVIRASLEDDLPIPFEQIAADACGHRQLTDKDHCFMVAATRKAARHERLQSLSDAGIRCVLIDAAVFAVHEAVLRNHPEIKTGRALIVYVDESHLLLAVTEDGAVLLTRNLPLGPAAKGRHQADSRSDLLLREIAITWHVAFLEKIPSQTNVFISTASEESELTAGLTEQFNCRTVAVYSFVNAKCAAEVSANAGLSLAEGLALRGLADTEDSSVFNLLRQETDNKDKPAQTGKQILVFALLAAAIAATFLTGLFRRLSYLDKMHNQIKDEIRTVFRQVLPEEKNIVSAPAQLDEHLQELRSEYHSLKLVSTVGAGPLELLHTITARTTADLSINVNGITITDDTVRLMGNCDSYQTLHQWRKRLQAATQFSQVSIADTSSNSSDHTVDFRLDIHLAREQE